MATIYITLEQAVEIHKKTIEVSGGGVLGQLDTGSLDSALFHIQNDDYYPTFEEKLTHLFFSACNFHCFQDGNKTNRYCAWRSIPDFQWLLICRQEFHSRNGKYKLPCCRRKNR